MRTRNEGKGENSKHEKTSKDRVTKHREKLKLDPTKYEESKRKDRERKKIEREIKRSELLIDKRALDKHREKEKLRMRRYRDNKKQKQQDTIVLSRKSATQANNRKEQKKTYQLKIKLGQFKNEKEVKRVQDWRLRKRENVDQIENEQTNNTNDAENCTTAVGQSPYTCMQTE